MGYDLTLPRTSPPVPRERASVGGVRGPGLNFALQPRDYFERSDRIAQWDALAQWASEPNPFYESWYLLPSLEHLDPNRTVSLLTLTADRQLAGLIPVQRETRYYAHPLPHLRNWTHANCFLGAPLVARGFERIFWREMLRWCDANAGLALFLHLSHQPGEGELHDALRAEAADHCRPAATVLREERAILASDLTPADYLARSLSTKKRKELRRQQRRLAEEGDLRFERRSDGNDIRAWAAAFMALEQSGWKGRGGSALACDPAMAQTFADALGGAARRGKLERLTLWLDGKPIAMLANFIAAPGAFSYKTAFDEAYSRFSPGVLLQQHNLDILDRGSVEWVDSCAAEDHPMIDHIWRERRSIARHSISIGGGLRRKAFGAIARRETGAPVGGIG